MANDGTQGTGNGLLYGMIGALCVVVARRRVLHLSKQPAKTGAGGGATCSGSGPRGARAAGPGRPQARTAACAGRSVGQPARPGPRVDCRCATPGSAGQFRRCRSGPSECRRDRPRLCRNGGGATRDRRHAHGARPARPSKQSAADADCGGTGGDCAPRLWRGRPGARRGGKNRCPQSGRGPGTKRIARGRRAPGTATQPQLGLPKAFPTRWAPSFEVRR